MDTVLESIQRIEPCAREICRGVQITQHGVHGVCKKKKKMRFGDNDLLFNHKTDNALVKVKLKNLIKSTFLDRVVLG